MLTIIVLVLLFIVVVHGLLRRWSRPAAAHMQTSRGVSPSTACDSDQQSAVFAAEQESLFNADDDGFDAPFSEPATDSIGMACTNDDIYYHPAYASLPMNIYHDSFDDGISSFDDGFSSFDDGFSSFDDGFSSFDDGFSSFDDGFSSFDDWG